MSSFKQKKTSARYWVVDLTEVRDTTDARCLTTSQAAAVNVSIGFSLAKVKQKIQGMSNLISRDRS